MSIHIRNAHIERLVAGEQKQRGQTTAVRTAEDLILERLTQLESERKQADRRTRGAA